MQTDQAGIPVRIVVSPSGKGCIVNTFTKDVYVFFFLIVLFELDPKLFSFQWGSLCATVANVLGRRYRSKKSSNSNRTITFTFGLILFGKA